MLVPLLPALAAAFGFRLIDTGEREEATQHREGSEEAEQAAAGASLAECAGEGIEAPDFHPSSVDLGTRPAGGNPGPAKAALAPAGGTFR
jgi:hypothetical protein